MNVVRAVLPAVPIAVAPFPMVDWSEDLKDFADTAGLISNLDLVIACDTAVAHLAGAMGRNVWTLLPYSPDWRWMLGRSDSPWYPTMRLFRQPTPGDWSSVIADVAGCLVAVPVSEPQYHGRGHLISPG